MYLTSWSVWLMALFFSMSTYLNCGDREWPHLRYVAFDLAFLVVLGYWGAEYLGFGLQEEVTWYDTFVSVHVHGVTAIYALIDLFLYPEEEWDSSGWVTVGSVIWF